MSERVEVLLHSVTLTSHYMSRVFLKYAIGYCVINIDIQHQLNRKHALRFITEMLILFALVASVDIFVSSILGILEACPTVILCLRLTFLLC